MGFWLIFSPSFLRKEDILSFLTETRDFFLILYLSLLVLIMSQIRKPEQ